MKTSPAKPGPDYDYWDVLAKLLGWRVREHTVRMRASYFTGPPGYRIMDIWATERDRIVEAIQKGAKE